MARLKSVATSGRTILLVDDSADYVEATRALLEREGHRVRTASNGPDALAILREATVDLLLLDFFMPGMTGEEVVRELRTFDPTVQVILQTGYSGEQPPREMMKRLDIQGYYDKSEGPEKLLLWTDVGLKAARAVQVLTRSRQGLQFILDVTPDLHRIQPINNLLQGILLQVTGLLGVVDSFLAVVDPADSAEPETPDGFLAVIDDETELIIHACTGVYADRAPGEALPPNTVEQIHGLLLDGGTTIGSDSTIVPLTVGELVLGVIYLDRAVRAEQDLELLRVFANQAAVAIQNAQLYALATVDRLTGLHVRSFFDKWLHRELRAAFRSRQSVTLIMMDLDGLKQINDQGGHLAGDRALAVAGDVLRAATRDTDILGRYGGDEFAIVLPQAGVEGTQLVGHRITQAFAEAEMPGVTLRASLGACTVSPAEWPSAQVPHPLPPEYFETTALALIAAADAALYASKRAGGGTLHVAPDLAWPALPTA